MAETSLTEILPSILDEYWVFMEIACSPWHRNPNAHWRYRLALSFAFVVAYYAGDEELFLRILRLIVESGHASNSVVWFRASGGPLPLPLAAVCVLSFVLSGVLLIDFASFLGRMDAWIPHLDPPVLFLSYHAFTEASADSERGSWSDAIQFDLDEFRAAWCHFLM